MLLQENATLFEISLCLSRACLGTKMIIGIQWRKNGDFLTSRTVIDTAVKAWCACAKRARIQIQNQDLPHALVQSLSWQWRCSGVFYNESRGLI